MSKKSNNSKKNRVRIPPITTRDRHHLAFPRSKWDRGYAKAICNAFVRYVPVVYHRELHYHLKSVPVPDGALLRAAWEKYLENRIEIDSYDAARAAAWLYVNIPDERFRAAMQFQVDFFATKEEQPR